MALGDLGRYFRNRGKTKYLIFNAYGPGQYGPGPIWARAPGPSLLSETLTENPTSKKQRCNIFVTYFYEAKKNCSAIPINLKAVSRRHILYGVQSCKKGYLQQTFFCAQSTILQKTYTCLVSTLAGRFSIRKPIHVL